MALVCALLWVAPAFSADDPGTTIEVTLVGNVDLERNNGEEDSGTGYSVGADFPMGRGYTSAFVSLARLHNFDETPGAYAVNLHLRYNILPGKRITPYIGLGVRSMWTDTEEVIDEVLIFAPVGGVKGGPVVPTMVEVAREESAQLLGFSGQVGFSWDFTKSGDWGLLGKVDYVKDLDKEQDGNATSWGLALKIPTPSKL